MRHYCTGLLLLLSVIVKAQRDTLVYHVIQKDARGNILPWYSAEPGKAYAAMISAVWNFWDKMPAELNGLPYYMSHQVWQPGFSDRRGIGGDQLAMALSSWKLLYAFSGNERVKENMKFMADYYCSHGFSPASAQWANLPFPYNTLVYSGVYDGDMILGKDYLQPDKAGSFGLELLDLYKLTAKGNTHNATDQTYLDLAVKIANSLCAHLRLGDESHSPLPFKVNAYTGQVGQLKDYSTGQVTGSSIYTTNYAGTLELLLGLIRLNQGSVGTYQASFSILLDWMKQYPLQNMKWGPFFEDITGWSDTQINAISFAKFIMNHPEYFPDWKTDVKRIFSWVYEHLGNDQWKKYGVRVINEQTAYAVPGNSHTSRQAAAELQYAALSGDTSLIENAVRQLNWATYMVAADGRNRYYNDENWLTDGYGDYVRHYLLAMRYNPSLAPSGENHILSSTSVVQQADYAPQLNKYIQKDFWSVPESKVLLYYRCFDSTGVETIRLKQKPVGVLVDDQPIAMLTDTDQPGYSWQPIGKRGDGLLTVRRNGNKVIVLR